MRRVVGRKRFLQINPYSGYLDTLAKFTLQHYACRRPGIPENRGIYFVLGFKYAQILLPYRYFFNPRPPGYFWPGTGIPPDFVGLDKKGTLLVRGYSDLRIVPMRWGGGIEDL